MVLLLMGKKIGKGKRVVIKNGDQLSLASSGKQLKETGDLKTYVYMFQDIGPLQIETTGKKKEIEDTQSDEELDKINEKKNDKNKKK